MDEGETHLCYSRANDKSLIYAGAGKGADIAAWKQAARAELAETFKWKTAYAQALLDLVKAFDRVPYWLLVQEARELGFPMWMLRLPIATYRLPRVVRVDKSYSGIIIALRGITAGSGLATTEMRLCMLRIIERALLARPLVAPTLFVEDVSAECTSPDRVIVKELGGFVEKVAQQIVDAGIEL